MRNRILVIRECCGKGDVLMSLDTDTSDAVESRPLSQGGMVLDSSSSQRPQSPPTYIPCVFVKLFVWFSSVKLEEVGSTLFFHCLAQAGLNLWLILHGAGVIGTDHHSLTNYNLSKLYAIFCCFPIGLLAAPEPTDILTTFCRPCSHNLTAQAVAWQDFWSVAATKCSF